jgi:hypothetical protein
VEKDGAARQATDGIITWRIRFACWMTKASARAHARTHAHSLTHSIMCNTYCFSTATTVSQTRLSVALYVHCLPCITFAYLNIKHAVRFVYRFHEHNCLRIFRRTQAFYAINCLAPCKDKRKDPVLWNKKKKMKIHGPGTADYHLFTLKLIRTTISIRTDQIVQLHINLWVLDTLLIRISVGQRLF